MKEASPTQWRLGDIGSQLVASKIQGDCVVDLCVIALPGDGYEVGDLCLDHRPQIRLLADGEQCARPPDLERLSDEQEGSHC